MSYCMHWVGGWAGGTYLFRGLFGRVPRKDANEPVVAPSQQLDICLGGWVGGWVGGWMERERGRKTSFSHMHEMEEEEFFSSPPDAVV